MRTGRRQTAEILASLITNRTIGAAYGAEDMNRVGAAMEYIAARLRECGKYVPITPKTDFTWTDFPKVSIFEGYMQDLRILHDALPLAITAPPVPVVGQSKDYMTHTEANDIEAILLEVEQVVKKVQAAWFFSGDLFAGEL